MPPIRKLRLSDEDALAGTRVPLDEAVVEMQRLSQRYVVSFGEVDEWAPRRLEPWQRAGAIASLSAWIGATWRELERLRPHSDAIRVAHMHDAGHHALSAAALARAPRTPLATIDEVALALERTIDDFDATLGRSGQVDRLPWQLFDRFVGRGLRVRLLVPSVRGGVGDEQLLALYTPPIQFYRLGGVVREIEGAVRDWLRGGPGAPSDDEIERRARSARGALLGATNGTVDLAAARRDADTFEKKRGHGPARAAAASLIGVSASLLREAAKSKWLRGARNS